MKRLHKKIGVGVLVAGLLMGGVGGLGGSVAHADENLEKIYEESILKSSLLSSQEISKLNRQQKSVLKRLCDQKDAFGDRRVDVIEVRNMREEGSGIKLNERSKYSVNRIFSDDNKGLESLKEIILKSRKKSFVRLCFIESGIEIVFIVL